jgi:hypothetical protein
LKNIMGGVEYYSSTTTSNGLVFITNSSASLVNAWADFWSTAGYDVYCTTLIPA